MYIHNHLNGHMPGFPVQAGGQRSLQENVRVLLCVVFLTGQMLFMTFNQQCEGNGGSF